jgi:LysM repeat protein
MCRNFPKYKKIETCIFSLGLIGIFLIGCNTDSAQIETPTQAFGGELTPFFTVTPSVSPEPLDSDAALSPTDIPIPTPTPIVYTVVENDTLTGIAFKNSVTLEDLIAANPGIDPNFLTIGLTLTIPIAGEEVSSVLPTATPVPIVLQPPKCYPLSDGNLQCMVEIENDQSFAVENVVALISLQSQGDTDPISKSGIPPLNLIPAGQRSVVVATFETSPLDYAAFASLLTVIPVSDDDQRYLQADLQINETNIAADRKQADISGTVFLGADETPPSVVWVAAFAYDAQQNIVGIRKWVADDDLLLASQVNFDITVYSLGPMIDHVEVQAEIRP